MMRMGDTRCCMDEDSEQEPSLEVEACNRKRTNRRRTNSSSQQLTIRVLKEATREADSEDIGDAGSGDSREEDWGTWTTLRPSEGERRLLSGSRMNIC
jgi:hypothetical protein